MKRRVEDIARITRGRLIQGAADIAITGVTTDSRQTRAGNLFVALQGERFDGHRFVAEARERGTAAALIREDRMEAEERRKLPPEFPLIAVPDPLQALGDLAADTRRSFAGPVVGITGSSGKTTTKEMAAAVFAQEGPCLKNEGNYNNQIGLPLTLLRLSPEHRFAVLEMGANRFGEIRALARIARPTIGLITNIGPAHLEGFGDLEGVARAKGELIQEMTRHDTFVVNRDDPRVVRLARSFPGRRVDYSLEEAAQVCRTGSRTQEDGTTFLELRLGDREIRVRLAGTGTHLEQDALAAAAVGFAAGLEPSPIQRGLEAFRPLPGRCRLLQANGHLRILDDTYNANPGSMRAALRTLRDLQGNGRAVVVLGDMAELGDAAPAAHKELGGLVARAGVSEAFYVGRYGDRFRQGAEEERMDPGRIHTYASVDPLIQPLRRTLKPGDVLLVKGSRVMQLERVIHELTGRPDS